MHVHQLLILFLVQYFFLIISNFCLLFIHSHSYCLDRFFFITPLLSARKRQKSKNYHYETISDLSIYKYAYPQIHTSLVFRVALIGTLFLDLHVCNYGPRNI